MLIHRPTALHLIRPYYAIWHLIHTFHKVKKTKKKKKLAKHLQNLSIQTKEHISWFISNAWLLLWQSAEEQFVAETSPDNRDLEIILIYGLPGSVKEFFTPEIRLMLRLVVGLIRSNNVFAVGPTVWLDFEDTLIYQ